VKKIIKNIEYSKLCIEMSESTEKKIISLLGLVEGILSILLCIVRISAIWVRKGTLSGNYDKFFILVFSFLLLFSRNYSWGKYVQIYCLIVAASLVTYFYPTDGYSFSLIIILVLLSQKYRMLEKKSIAKILLGSVIFWVLLVSGMLNLGKNLFQLFTAIVLSLIFATSLIIIKICEISEFLDKIQDLERKILNMNRASTYFLKESDLKEFSFSPAELEILKYLCIYNLTNKEIGEKLNKSIHTVKTQLKSILTKSGAQSRHQLALMFKSSFSEECCVNEI